MIQQPAPHDPSRIWASIAFLGLWGVFYVFASDIKTYTDEMGHYLLNRYFWRYPDIMLSQWQRPLYTLLTAPFALLGYRGQALFSVLSGLVCALATVGIARHYGIRRSYLIPILLLCFPPFVDVLWTNLAQAPFAALLACALLAGLKRRFALAAVLVGFTPLIRLEGAIAIAVFAFFYLSSGNARSLPWLAAGALFWSLASWVLSGDPLSFLKGGYPMDLGLRLIQWDFLRKFHDDFSGPVWFVSAVAGLLACRRLEVDLVHTTYGFLFVFIVFVWSNLVPLPAGTFFGWVYVAPLSPILACYVLKGLNVLMDGRDDWRPGRELVLRSLLVALPLVWTGVAVVYLMRRNPYGPMLLLLACLGWVSTVFWLGSSRLGSRTRVVLVTLLTVVSLGYSAFKAPLYRSNPRDMGLQRLAAWWLEERSNQGVPVWCALWGFYYFTGIDPIQNMQPERFLPGRPGYTIIWDSWGMERWGRISTRDLEGKGYLPIPCPVTIPDLELRVYRKPSP